MQVITDCDEMWVQAIAGVAESDAWNGGESSESAIARGQAFLQWLMRRSASVSKACA